MIQKKFEYLKLMFLFLLSFVMIFNIDIKYKSKNKDVTMSQTTVISTYFKINRSKHRDSYYQKWNLIYSKNIS